MPKEHHHELNVIMLQPQAVPLRLRISSCASTAAAAAAAADLFISARARSQAMHLTSMILLNVTHLCAERTPKLQLRARVAQQLSHCTRMPAAPVPTVPDEHFLASFDLHTQMLWQDPPSDEWMMRQEGTLSVISH